MLSISPSPADRRDPDGTASIRHLAHLWPTLLGLPSTDRADRRYAAVPSKNFFSARMSLSLSAEVSECGLAVRCVSAAPDPRQRQREEEGDEMRIASREHFLPRYCLRLRRRRRRRRCTLNGPSSSRRRDALAHDRRITLIPSQSASPTLARPSPLLPIPTISALSKILAGWGWMDGPTHKKWQFFTSR